METKIQRILVQTNRPIFGRNINLNSFVFSNWDIIKLFRKNKYMKFYITAVKACLWKIYYVVKWSLKVKSIRSFVKASCLFSILNGLWIMNEMNKNLCTNENFADSYTELIQVSFVSAISLTMEIRIEF